MKGTGFFRRFLCVLLVSLLIIPVALADKVDLSSMSDDEIVELLAQVNQALVDRRINKTVKMAPGTYTGGKDIPVGKYIFTCTATGNDWGNMFVYNKEGKQVVWEVVSAPEQGQDPQTSFITLKKDYTLKCSMMILLRPLNLNTNFNTRTVECTSGFCGKIVFSLCRDASEACAYIW